jgi:hypothetical protein
MVAFIIPNTSHGRSPVSQNNATTQPPERESLSGATQTRGKYYDVVVTPGSMKTDPNSYILAFKPNQVNLDQFSPNESEKAESLHNLMTEVFGEKRWAEMKKTIVPVGKSGKVVSVLKDSARTALAQYRREREDQVARREKITASHPLLPDAGARPNNGVAETAKATKNPFLQAAWHRALKMGH